jgi:hypothetical protein
VDIYLIGRGIARRAAQMTVEALDALRSSRIVFDLSGDVRAIRRLHPKVLDLTKEYWTGELCDDVYDRLQERVLTEAEMNGPTISMIVDGHPMFFDDVNWGIVRAGRRRGLRVQPLPGISCLDVMTIDLGVDLGDGAQIVHANRLVLYDVALDPYLHTFLLQVGKFGTSFFSRGTRGNRCGRFKPLVEHLMRFYPADHMVNLIVSSGNVAGPTAQKRIRLRALDDARSFLHRYQDDGLTLHVPSVDRGIVNEQFGREVDDERHLERLAIVEKRRP